MRAVLIFGLCLIASALAFAQTPSEADIEQRARHVGKSLRCVVCQNQSIDNSNAPLAADMRVLVRERIRSGDSDDEVIAYMRERYGDFVLLKPPLQANTVLLWVTPLGLLAVFLIWYVVQSRRPRKSVELVPLSEDEQQKLQDLMKKTELPS
ncbi:MAG: cytochrome c-type biogenesis protein CcmH [Robiginitomaculum sp.]|nr:MAG: cytochrome c-type biogenesis protein CcmH [Robiginitomaculum sp.]